MADLSVTIGADTAELEKKVKSAGKTIEKELNSKGGGGGGKGGGGANKAVDFASNLMAGNVATAIGSLFGPEGEAIGKVIDIIKDKVKELMDQAIELRSLSYQTGLTTEQIQGLEGVSKASGISINKLADNISEYNRRLGYAQMHGGEMNVVLNKMGVSFDDIKNRTFTYFDAIKALSDAQAAGTDEAILNHYAQVMLGSSYKELLPLIKMGSENIRIHGERVYKTSQDSVDALASAGDAWNDFTETVKNRAMELLGTVVQAYNNAFLTNNAADAAKLMQQVEIRGNYRDPEELLKYASTKLGTMNPEKKKQILSDAIGMWGTSNPYGKILSNDEFEDFTNALERMFPSASEANKLNPFGAEQAQGASAMQAMGGGDIFGAIAFNPMDRTATATEASAEALKSIEAKMDANGVDTIGIGNDPERSR